MNTIKAQSPNIIFAKAGDSCFYESEALNPSFVHLMKFSAENRHLREAAKQYMYFRTTPTSKTRNIRSKI
jgi:hypothetical protein